MEDFTKYAKVEKVNDELGIVFGWALVCAEEGVEYFDLQDDSIVQNAITEAGSDFMQKGAKALDMHKGDQIGTYVFMFPMTDETKKAFGIECEKTGLMVGLKPNADVLAKFKSGEYTGFSIGGKVLQSELVDV